MRQIRLAVNNVMWRTLSDPLWDSAMKCMGDPNWDYSVRSTWSNVSSTVSSSGVFLPRGVGNIIKYRS